MLKLVFVACLLTSQLHQFLCQQKTITVDGKLYWSLIFRYDNSKNTAPLKHTISTRIFQKFDQSQLTENLNEVKKTQSTKVSAGLDVTASYKAVSATAKVATEYSNEVTNFISSKISTTSSSKFESERTESREYNVGPKSVLELYQLHFEAPGVEYALPAVSTVNEAPKVVPITVVVEPIRFLANIKVQIADSESGRPTERIREISNKNDDINYKFGGKYVYLVPEYTYSVDKAMTNVDVVISRAKKDGYIDIAMGAGGSYRFIVPVKDAYTKNKITEIALLRNEKSAASLPAGYDGMSKDINEGRLKDYLYLVWKTVKA